MIHAPSILLAEDEGSDVLLLALALKKARISNELIVAKDGQELVDYLTRPELLSGRTAPPGLIILDLKMPRMGGFEVLCWLAAQPQYSSLPAVVLTSSALESDMRQALQLGARGFYIKPPTHPPLLQLLRRLHSRWLAPLPTNFGPQSIPSGALACRSKA